MKLLAVLLVPLLLSVCLGKVGDFIRDCPGFFPKLNGVISPPKMFVGRQYKQICQTLNNNVEFATFYNIKNRIPVYSSYKFTGQVKCTRKTGKWFIEPQLDDQTQGGNMKNESGGNYGAHQALNEDYKNQTPRCEYHRGHLAPVYHSSTQSCAVATFTLTNAAPQQASFNRRWFHYAESKMAKKMSTDCINKGLKAYVVTGVVPGNTKLKNRVLIPSHYWTAFCCLDNNNKPKLSLGYYAENKKNSTINQVSLQGLERKLKIKYGQNFTVFPGGC
ncbi:endonuclease domain-containing 1 protein-like [Silurus meridionalis]|uniref:endonuclease domain-containing 1 protein-like n=1 Tax=Silurus meridionalis TaxID=175797 RepID=UPI001EEC8148|nr:endonuclease domain-containing 1 protein-like [Silurus meridionalis]KAI5090261.1 endonuclease domain-containing 1 protein-like [Silurus meridionalis]